MRIIYIETEFRILKIVNNTKCVNLLKFRSNDLIFQKLGSPFR